MAQSMRRRDAVLVFVLSVVIGILGFLLVASFILYVILRRQYSQKRRSDELILKIHDHDNVSVTQAITTNSYATQRIRMQRYFCSFGESLERVLLKLALTQLCKRRNRKYYSSC